jgi:hypothetical protein
MLIVRRTARSAVFAAVLQAERGRLPDIGISLGQARPGFLPVKVDCGGRVREFSVPQVSKGQEHLEKP